MRRTILSKLNSVQSGVSDSSVCSCGNDTCKYRDFGLEAVNLLQSIELSNGLKLQFELKKLAVKHAINLSIMNVDMGFTAVPVITDKPIFDSENLFIYIRKRRMDQTKADIEVLTHDVDFKVTRTI